MAWNIIIFLKPNLEKSFIVPPYRCEKIGSLLHLLKQVSFCFLVSKHILHFFFVSGTVNLIQERSNYEEVNPVLWMVSVDYLGRSPSRWLVQSEFTLGLELQTDSFFHSIKCTNCQKDSIELDANHYCRRG